MKNILLYLSLAVVVASCSKDDNNAQQPSRLTGPAVTMGNGKINSWVALDGQGTPTALGFTISKGAYDNLPATLPATTYMLELPAAASTKTPFNHLMINWNPQGHEPIPIYGVPHFDMHFYMVPMSEVMSILPYQVNPGPFDNKPAAAYMPASYVKNPGGVPGMGAHWIDPGSPEFHGQAFTETFIYGSYDGHVTFMEPMITLAYLKTNPALDKAIPQPAQFEKPGYYPTHYTIRTDADGNQEIGLTQLVKH